ncbi:hypothetical protein OF001_U260052 [Pseudomonas sp. OF001]|nr:hypothetical protein OF001_U260052 [Pseudomonas sp. OF001]
MAARPADPRPDRRRPGLRRRPAPRRQALRREDRRREAVDLRQRPAPQRPGRDAAVHPDRRVRRGAGRRRTRRLRRVRALPHLVPAPGGRHPGPDPDRLAQDRGNLRRRPAAEALRGTRETLDERPRLRRLDRRAQHRHRGEQAEEQRSRGDPPAGAVRRAAAGRLQGPQAELPRLERPAAPADPGGAAARAGHHLAAGRLPAPGHRPRQPGLRPPGKPLQPGRPRRMTAAARLVRMAHPASPQS